MSFKRYNPGDKRISAGDMNRRADAIEGLLGSGGSGSFTDRAGIHYRRIAGEDPGATVTPVRLKSETGAGIYTVTPIIANSTTSPTDWADGPNSGSSTDDVQARHEGNFAGLPSSATFGAASAKAWMFKNGGENVFSLMIEKGGTRKDLSYTGEHTEAAATDAGWSLETQQADGKQGVKLTISCGDSYYDAGNQTFYNYVRDVVITNDGRIYSGTPERRVVVDVPQDCNNAATPSSNQSFSLYAS